MLAYCTMLQFFCIFDNINGHSCKQPAEVPGKPLPVYVADETISHQKLYEKANRDSK